MGARAVQIDTGTDLMHPDIQGNLWLNPGEIHGKGANAANGYENGSDVVGNGESSLHSQSCPCISADHGSDSWQQILAEN